MPVATEGRGLLCKARLKALMIQGYTSIAKGDVRMWFQQPWEKQTDAKKGREAGTTQHSFSNEYKNLTAKQHLFPHNPKT